MATGLAIKISQSIDVDPGVNNDNSIRINNIVLFKKLFLLSD